MPLHDNYHNIKCGEKHVCVLKLKMLWKIEMLLTVKNLLNTFTKAEYIGTIEG